MTEENKKDEEQPQDSLSRILDEPVEPEAGKGKLVIDDEEIPEDKVPDLIRKGKQFERRNAEFNQKEEQMRRDKERLDYYAQVDARLAAATPEEREAVKEALGRIGTGRTVPEPSEPEPEFEDEEVKKLAKFISTKLGKIENKQGEAVRYVQETERQREHREKLEREMESIKTAYGATDEEVTEALQFGRREGVSRLEHAFKLRFPEKTGKPKQEKAREEEESVEEQSFSGGNARPRPGSGGVELTRDEREFCRAHGKDPKKYAKAKRYGQKMGWFPGLKDK